MPVPRLAPRVFLPPLGRLYPAHPVRRPHPRARPAPPPPPPPPPPAPPPPQATVSSSSSTVPGTPTPSPLVVRSALTRTPSPAISNQAPGAGDKPRMWLCTSCHGRPQATRVSSFAILCA